MPNRPRILVVRGDLANPWELRPWELLQERFDVAYLGTPRNWFDVSQIQLRRIPVKTLGGHLPRGKVGALVSGVAGERYLDADDAFEWADVVHAAELSFWFSADAAKRKPRSDFKLVLTVWETLPFLRVYRNRHARANRDVVLRATDLFLPATERARDALLLEGVEADRTMVAYPGVDVERFASAKAPERAPDEHVVISPGRLVWEKGHQDVMRALAAIRRGLVEGATSGRVRLLVVGAGPEEDRLREYADELGIGADVEFGAVPYEEMPAEFARASCMVLASLSTAAGGLVLWDLPRVFWEEQFGMVLAEAMAAGLPIVASSSGAIPEVCGDAAAYFVPGDWLGLARRLVEGPLSRPPGTRTEHSAELVRRYSIEAAAERLASAYERVLEGR